MYSFFLKKLLFRTTQLSLDQFVCIAFKNSTISHFIHISTVYNFSTCFYSFQFSKGFKWESSMFNIFIDFWKTLYRIRKDKRLKIQNIINFYIWNSYFEWLMNFIIYVLYPTKPLFHILQISNQYFNYFYLVIYITSYFPVCKL